MADAASVADFAFVATTAPSLPLGRAAAEPATLQSLQDSVHAQGVLLQHMLDQIRTTQAHLEELHESLSDVASLLSGGGGGGAAEMKEHHE